MTENNGGSSRVAYPVTAGMTSDYRSFDRSTRAGRLLHNLYNPRSVDSTLDKELAKRLEENRKAREAAAIPKPKPIPKSRAYVDLPSPPKKEYPKFLPPVQRRPLKQIQQNEKEEQVKYEKTLHEKAERGEIKMFQPARTEEDKFVLQHKFQFGIEPTQQLVHAFNAERTRVAGTIAEGKGITQPYAFNSASAAREKRQEQERSLWNRRFHEVSNELSERKSALAELEHSAPPATATKQMIAYRESKTRLMNEIRELMKELKDVDQKLKALNDDEE